MSETIKFVGGGQVEIEPEAGSEGLTRVTLTGARRPKISIVQVTKEEAFEFAKALKQESNAPPQDFSASEVGDIAPEDQPLPEAVSAETTAVAAEAQADGVPA